MTMTCREIRVSLVTFSSEDRSDACNREVTQHLRECVSCRSWLASEQALNAALRQQAAIPAPSPDFETRVLGAATAHSVGAGKRWSHTVLGGAVAAALALGIGLGVMLDGGPSSPDTPAVAETSLPEDQSQDNLAAMGEPTERTVRLAFRSGEPLENVTLTLKLPPHVELASWPGQQELSWKVSLDAGENILALPLKVLFPGSGELVARLDTGERQKTFRAAIPDYDNAVKEDPSS